jgi:hypothetical protein
MPPCPDKPDHAQLSKLAGIKATLRVLRAELHARPAERERTEAVIAATLRAQRLLVGTTTTTARDSSARGTHPLDSGTVPELRVRRRKWRPHLTPRRWAPNK